MNKVLGGSVIVSGFFLGFLLVYWIALKMPKNSLQKQENFTISVIIDQKYEDDSASDLFKRGKSLWKKRKYKEAVQVMKAAFQKTAPQLRAPIARYLGDAYLFGKGVDQNPDTSFIYYTLQNMTVNGWTALRLGQIYKSRSFRGYDLEKAKNYFLIAQKDKIAAATGELKKLKP